MREVVESMSGIRGIVGQGIDADLAQQYAHAFAQHIRTAQPQGGSLVVGGDARSSSRELMDVFITVFVGHGFDVYDVGISTTPVTEFAVRKYGARGGVMVTASHNPPEYNGWKLLQDDGAIITVAVSEKIITAVHAGVLAHHSQKPGIVRDVSNESIDCYCDDIIRIVGAEYVEAIKQQSPKIVLDPNGSAVAKVIEVLFAKLDISVDSINTKQGEFMRTIEPTVETLRGLVEVVDTHTADFGCGFDADADRVEIVLPSTAAYAQEYSPMVSGDYVVALGIQSVFETGGDTNKPIVVNIATSHLIHEVAATYAVDVVEVDVGETNVVTKMQELDSIIGGEGSSGGIIESSTRCRDGLVSVVLLLRLLAIQQRSLSDILAALPKYYSVKKKVACSTNDAIEDIVKALQQQYQDKGFVLVTPPSVVGGFKVIVDSHSFIFYRASATEPGQFRIHADSNNKAKAQTLSAQAVAVFNKLTN